jgi:hypothetical protein
VCWCLCWCGRRDAPGFWSVRRSEALAPAGFLRAVDGLDELLVELTHFGENLFPGNAPDSDSSFAFTITMTRMSSHRGPVTDVRRTSHAKIDIPEMSSREDRKSLISRMIVRRPT